MGERADRRRTRLVDREFQVGMACRLLLVVTGCFIAGVVLAFAPSAIVLATGSEPGALEAAASEFLLLHRRIWPAVLLPFAGIFVYSIVFSHRIAGPVYRINAILRALLDDRHPTVVKFRDGDFFQPTAQLLGELSVKIRASRGNASGEPDTPSGPPPS